MDIDLEILIANIKTPSDTGGIRDIPFINPEMLQSHKMPIKIDPEMRVYIKNSFSELRICTTCDGPILLPTRIKPPKMTDVVLDVEGRTFYISAVQAPRIKSINVSMLPKCALQKKKR